MDNYCYINHVDECVAETANNNSNYKYIIVFKNPFVAIPISNTDTLNIDYEVVDLEQKHLDVKRILMSEEYPELIYQWSLIYDDVCYNTEKDELVWTYCGTVANWIAHLFGYPSNPIQLSGYNYIKTTWSLFQAMRGVFLVTVDIFYRESHHFVLFIKDDIIIIYQGYGDIERAQVIELPKNHFFNVILRDYSDGIVKYNEIYKLFNVLALYPYRNGDVFDEYLSYTRIY